MKSYVEQLHEEYGWPLKIHARGYDAYLIDVQPLVEGRVAPIYRFPGGDSLINDCELKGGREPCQNGRAAFGKNLRFF